MSVILRPGLVFFSRISESMRLQLLALLASAGLTIASKHLVSLFLAGYDTSDLKGKIIDSKSNNFMQGINKATCWPQILILSLSSV